MSESSFDVDLSSSEEEEASVPSTATDSEDDGTSSSSGGEDGEEEEQSGADQGGAADVDDDDDAPTQAQLAARREANVAALVAGSLQVERRAVLPRLLPPPPAEATLRAPFRVPAPGAPAGPSDALKRALAARKAFVPWGAAAPFKPLNVPLPPPPPPPAAEAPRAPVELPPGVEPLVLWEPPPGGEGAPVVVDPALTRFLRPHQREGVRFMFECVAGLRDYGGAGCILADDMGLGKTLQGIALLWTLLTAPAAPALRAAAGAPPAEPGAPAAPLARRVVICCPTSLVANWDAECAKWLDGRVRTLPLCESSRDEVARAVSDFLSPRTQHQVLIVSYETFRLHAARFEAPGACDLLLCDEAHRLKNGATLTSRALGALGCRRRVLLSGTPLQNQLQEFYAMVSFANPGVLGTAGAFRRRFEAPILAGREPGAPAAAAAAGAERAAELAGLVNAFILRRTNALLSAHLPPKVVQIVCCAMTPLQRALYEGFVASRSVRSLFSGHRSARVLSAITSLRKLLNHPKLIYDALHSPAAADGAEGAAGFEGAAGLFPPGLFDGGRPGRPALPPGWEGLSGKFGVVARMLGLLRSTTKDRVVLVSNYTQTLDLFGALCRERGWPALRLDGSTSIGKRQKLVVAFNDARADQFCFLLSSKAGGCGLNLVGGNRLVLFDSSWNPADDKQAMGRVWRDGQKKRVFVYRFMTTGTIEERVFQRQLSKEGLQAVVQGAAAGGGVGGAAGGGGADGGEGFGAGGAGGAGPNLMSMEELRDLFSVDPDTLSTTYDTHVAGAARARRRPPAGAGAAAKGAAAAAARRRRAARRGGAGSSSEEAEDDEEDEEGSGEEQAADTAGEEQQEEEHVPPSRAGMTILRPQRGAPREEDLASWGHHSDAATAPDAVLAAAAGGDVTFVFSCAIEGRPVEGEPGGDALVPLGAGGGGGAGPRPALQQQQQPPPPPAAKPAAPPARVEAENAGEAAPPAPARAPAAEPAPRPSLLKKRPSAAAAAAAPAAAPPPRKRAVLVLSDSDDDFR